MSAKDKANARKTGLKLAKSINMSSKDAAAKGLNVDGRFKGQKMNNGIEMIPRFAITLVRYDQDDSTGT